MHHDARRPRPGRRWTSSLSGKPYRRRHLTRGHQRTPRRVTGECRLRARQARSQHRPADLHWRRRARRRHRDALRQHRGDAVPGSHSLDRTSSATATLATPWLGELRLDIAWDLEPVAAAFVPKVLHTGSIATFLAPGAAAVKSLLQQCRHDSTITYDPNIRPALLGSHAEAKSIFEDLVHLTDVVKLSDEDAQWLYPRKDLEDTAAHILGLGAGLAVITKGSQAHCSRHPPPPSAFLQ